MATFRKIGDEADDVGLTSIESMCMNCERNGTTQLLLTSIPFFKQVVLMSFECPHCGFRNAELQSGGAVQDKGCKHTLKVETKEDLNRQIVKSEYAAFRLEDLDLEFPPSGNGNLSTIEGLLRSALEELKTATLQGEMAAKLDAIVASLALYASGLSFPFVVSIDDPSGNSYIENPIAPKKDPNMQSEEYIRTEEHNKMLGLHVQGHEPTAGGDNEQFEEPEGSVIRHNNKENLEKEVYGIPADCPNCQVTGKSEMCITDVPFFKEVIIMAFNCQSCGFRNNEVKGGGEIPEKGKRISLEIKPKSHDEEAFMIDMSRDVVKSTSAGITIPEIDLEVTHGSLGGQYTTIEGMLIAIKAKLEESSFAGFTSGDSATNEARAKYEKFFADFEMILNGEMAFTFVLDDPLGNSFLYSPTAPEPEPRLKEELYARTHDQNELFGLNDMNTENYDDVTSATEKKNVFASEKSSGGAQSTMADLQTDGKEAHPHAEVVAKPELEAH